MNDIKSNVEIGEWLSSFQKEVHLIMGYDGLVFTVSIWRDQMNHEASHPKAEVVRRELSLSVP
jgi:hypothetical protein